MRGLLTLVFILTPLLWAAQAAHAQDDTRRDLISVGSRADVGDGWTVGVVSVNLDAATTIRADNPRSRQPAPGQRMVLVSLTATYNGPDANQFPGHRLHVVGPTRVAYDAWRPDVGCGTIANRLNSISDVFQGGTIAGDVCWVVSAEDAVNLVMYVDPPPTIPSTSRVSFALRPTLAQDRSSRADAGSGPLSTHLGSPTDPIPLGESADVGGGWIVQLSNVEPDATDAVLGRDLHNRMPAAGQRISLVNAVVTNHGETYRPFPTQQIHWPGFSTADIGTTCMGYELADAFPRQVSVQRGGTLEGVICRILPERMSEGLRLAIDPLGDDRQSPTYFAVLSPERPAPVPPRIVAPSAPVCVVLSQSPACVGSDGFIVAPPVDSR